MRFDDRLLTVLNQPAGDRHDLAVRWRQLVDLVARSGSNAASPTVVRALETIRADAASVDESSRAAAARAVASLPLPQALLEYFASDVLAVSAPVLAAATLDPIQWKAIVAGVDDETKRFIVALHPDVGHEPQDHLFAGAAEPVVAVAAASESQPEELSDDGVENGVLPHDDSDPGLLRSEPLRTVGAPSLHDVVERIERRRRSRSAMQRGSQSVAAAGTSPSLFRWECGPSGEIAWVDGAPRGAVIGRSIARTHDGDRLDPDVVRAFTLRAPFRDGSLSVAGDGLLAGEWKISGVPAFEPTDGRFAGYRGIALREQDVLELPEAQELLPDPDSLRELVHEIKTPLNAIIGFAEIIEGQYLGPADRRYRERAQEIVRQARLLLTAIDDLDFAAKVHSSAEAIQRRVSLRELVERMTPALRELAERHRIELDPSRLVRDATAATEPELADRLIFRMCSALIEEGRAGERLRLSLTQAGENWRVSMSRPESLSHLSEEQLLGGRTNLERGFSLRLVRGLARIAGAELTAPPGSISLLFPRA